MRKSLYLIILLIISISCTNKDEILVKRENSLLKRELDFERKVKLTDSISKKLLEITKIFVKKFTNKDVSLKEHLNLIVHNPFYSSFFSEDFTRDKVIELVQEYWKEGKIDIQPDFNSFYLYRVSEERNMVTITCKFCVEFKEQEKPKVICGLGTSSIIYNKEGLITNIMFLPIEIKK
jgi:hypothetical protein